MDKNTQHLCIPWSWVPLSNMDQNRTKMLEGMDATESAWNKTAETCASLG